MKLRLALALLSLALVVGCASDDAPFNNVPATETGIVTATYSGRAVYRNSQAPVIDLTIQVAAARADGSPTDEVFGTTRTDARGHFTVTSTAPRDRKVVLVAAAVEESADTGGDRRAEGYAVKKHETVLGSLPDPSPARPNTLLVNPKEPGHPSEN